ncbi:choice-of-anchor D domain-containing protein [Vulgatibacter sp.]|uniref:choice-of-anchor D domain-containing protein n=1 Tax=Vulgatibacter sp. TaxID=1971226 RepID=UPI0035618E5D
MLDTRSRLLALLLLLSAVVNACSCGDRPTTGLAPKLVVTGGATPAGTELLVDLGAVAVGRTGERIVRLRNEGTAPLELQPFALEAPFSAKQLPAALPIGGEVELQVGFAPLRPGPVQARRQLVSNGGSFELLFRGEGVAAAVACEPRVVDLGNAVVGERVERTVTCTNHSTVEARLHVQTPEGPDAGAFDHERSFEEDPLLLAPGASGSFVVLGVPQRLGRHEATLAILDGASTTAHLSLAMTGNQAAFALEPQGCIDFGFVAPDAVVEQALLLRNLGSAPLAIDSLALAAADYAIVGATAPFTIPADDPDTAAAENEQPITVRFAPSELGRRDGTLRIGTDDPRNPEVEVCLRGFAGGPVLACNPGAVDFGKSAIDVPLVRHLLCSNVGVAVPGTEEDDLHVRSVGTSTEPFTAAVVGGIDPAGYPVGAAFTVAITWSPFDEGIDAGELQIETNEPRTLAVPITGEALDLLPCSLQIDPVALDFGLRPPGSEATLRTVLHNVGRGPCLLRDVAVQGEGFALDGDPRDAITLESGERLLLPVRFTAGRSAVEGSLDLVASDPAQPNRSVPLRGAGMEGCLRMVPERLDFGTLTPGCSSVAREVQLVNACPGAVTVESVALDAGTPFTVAQAALPAQLLAGDVLRLTANFAPQAEGTFEHLLRVRTDESATAFTLPLVGHAAHDADQIDSWIQENDNAVDVLLVIDNSGSMAGEQQALADNLPALLDWAQTQGTDFQIGVTTTGLASEGGGCPGGVDGGEDGRLYPVDNSHPRILTPSTPDLAAHYAFNTQVGTCHGSEMGLEAATRALSSPVIDNADDPRHVHPNDGNLGFLREEASLSVIFVSDDDDHSVGAGGAFFQLLLGLKDFDPSRVSAHAIVGMVEGCDQVAAIGTRYLDVVRRAGGVAQDICTSDWVSTLQAIGTGAFATRDRFPLRGLPADENGDGTIDEAELDVRVGGTVVPQARWSYDVERNQVVFLPQARPEPGDLVEVQYRMACL